LDRAGRWVKVDPPNLPFINLVGVGAGVPEPALLLVSPEPGWAAPAFESLLPGAHALVLGDASVGLDARRTGFEFRDTLTIMSVGPLTRFALLFRKPLVETTITAQVMATSTGALNIGACRVGLVGKVEKHTTAGDASIGGHRGIYGAGRSGLKPNQVQRAADGLNPRYDPDGRWPTNLVFVHGPRCQKVGTKKVRGSQLNQVIERGGSTSSSMEGGARQTASHCEGYTDEHGLETVVAYECESGCPVAMLDAQSGDRKSTGPHPSDAKSASNFRPTQGAYQQQGPLYDDAGGASRFFPQFKDDAELLTWLTTLITPPA
jgi:hypothetical protein